MFDTSNDKGKMLAKCGLAVLCLLMTCDAMATKSAGAVASEIVDSFGSLAKLITAGAYLGGLAFSVGAILKFKQHKDNPTQVPIGTPISLVFIAAALLFLPSILGVAGQTIFGADAKTAGASGQSWSSGSISS